MTRVLLAALLALAGCVGPGVAKHHAQGFLTARPKPVESTLAPAPGMTAFGDGILYVPEGIERPAAMMMVLHGHNHRLEHMVAAFKPYADAYHMVLFAPRHRDKTWDLVITGTFGWDTEAIDRDLARLFEQVPIDPRRILVAGFSDGASYALSLGLGNGALFGAIMAFAPGAAYSTRIEGRPRVFIAHGVYDQRLPIDKASRRIVPALRKAGLEVEYREFDGEHVMRWVDLDAAFEWLLGPS